MGKQIVSAGPPNDREATLQEAEAAGERLLALLDELWLSLSAAYLSMSLDMLRVQDRGSAGALISNPDCPWRRGEEQMESRAVR